MPHPPLYPWNQDDDQIRSIDVVHIEPSIREGTHLVSSLYGRDASAPLYRFPPVSSNNAWIRGNTVIPSILTAEDGTWIASPSAYFEYQWMANGIDIPFATNKQWTSTTEYDNQTITVEIRGINYLGQDITISSGMVISILEPQEVRGQENLLITGLPQGLLAQTTRDDRTMIVSGLETTDRMDVNSSVSYYFTGTGALDREDVNAMGFSLITGLETLDKVTALEWDITVINYPLKDSLVESVPTVMDLKNPGAELGTLGWEVFGSVWAVNDDLHSGWLSWNGGDNVGPTGSNTPFSYFWQDVPVSDEWIADIDAGLCSVEVEYYQFSEETQDMANVRIEFRDVNGTIIDSNNGSGLWASPNDIWFRMWFEDNIPVGTRFIRVYGEFNLMSGDNNDAGLDDIKLSIRKGNRFISRDYGPAFNQWRIDFIQARTWSGCSLSELEFRATSGGTDLAIGGSPIFGSAGLGVVNADYAFDDLRNTGYWAGEEYGVAKGTAWLGYNMGTPVRPQAIDITARNGSDSLQVGKEIMLKCSDDGVRWINAMYIPESRIGEFTSGQRKEILIPQGTYNFWKDIPGGESYTYDRDIHALDDFPGKGALYKSYARINIDNLAVLIDDNSNTPFNFRLQLARCNLQKSGNWLPGMVSEVLEDIPLVSAGINAGLTWITTPCSQSWEFEVDDLFLVRFYDVDAASNPINANEGRTRWISNYNGNLSPFMLRNGIAEFVCTWEMGNQNLVIGNTNPSGFKYGQNGVNFAVDFSGTVF